MKHGSLTETATKVLDPSELKTAHPSSIQMEPGYLTIQVSSVRGRAVLRVPHPRRRLGPARAKGAMVWCAAWSGDRQVEARCARSARRSVKRRSSTAAISVTRSGSERVTRGSRALGKRKKGKRSFNKKSVASSVHISPPRVYPG